MANPQLHNGHTRIANEILNEVMKVNLNGTQFRLVLAIWRYTYGFQRKGNEMSISYLSNVIDAGRTQVDRELKALIDRNIIVDIGFGKKGARILGFNKNHKEWGEREQGENPVSFPKKESKPKKKSTPKEKYDDENTYYKMAVYFYGRVEKVASDAGIGHLIKRSNMQSWADDMRKLIEIDGVDKQLAKEVMDWVTENSFWRTNVLSARRLRERFLELAIKMNAEKKPARPKQQYDSRDKEIMLQQWIQDGNDPNEFDWRN